MVFLCSWNSILSFRVPRSELTLHARAGQVENRHQKQPDHVYQVPVKAHHLDRGVVLPWYFIAGGLLNQPEDAAKPRENVNSVDACHDPVEHQEQLNLV